MSALPSEQVGPGSSTVRPAEPTADAELAEEDLSDAPDRETRAAAMEFLEGMGERVDGADPLTGELPWDGFRDGRIQNFLGLDWAGRKLAEFERAIAQNDACHAGFLSEVEVILEAKRKSLMGDSAERLTKLQAPLREKAAFFRAAVESYAREVGRKGVCIGSAKSRVLPSGLEVVWRKVPEKVKVKDLDELARWAAVSTVASATIFPEKPPPRFVDLFSRSGLNKWHATTKDAPPGTEHVPATETLSVTTPYTPKEKK